MSENRWTYVDHLGDDGKVMFFLNGEPYRALDLSAVLGPGRHHTWQAFKAFAATMSTWVPIEDPELVALQTRPQHVEASCEEEKPAKTVVKRVRRPDAEPKRPPLPGYGQRTPFDPFSDFIVHHREEVSVNAKPFAGLSLDGCEQFRAPRSI